MSGYLKNDHEKLIALGEYIRNQREKNKIGLREMAKSLNISNAYLSNLETGKHSMANPLLLRKIADILNIDHLKLFKIIGYTNQDLDDILEENIPNENTQNSKVDTILTALEKFDEEEFELIERYIELLTDKK